MMAAGGAGAATGGAAAFVAAAAGEGGYLSCLRKCRQQQRKSLVGQQKRISPRMIAMTMMVAAPPDKAVGQWMSIKSPPKRRPDQPGVRVN